MNEQFAKNIELCKWQIIEVSGDKFILTAITKDAFIKLDELVIHGKLGRDQLLNGDYVVVDLAYERIFLYTSRDLSRASSYLTTERIRDKNTYQSDLWTKRVHSQRYDLRPCLIPITQVGEYEWSFSKEFPSGCTLDGLTIQTADGQILGTGNRVELTDASFPLTVTDSCDDNSVAWTAADGVLVSNAIWSSLTLEDMVKYHFLPDGMVNTVADDPPQYPKHCTVPSSQPLTVLQSTGDPDLDNMINDIFNHHHPAEQQFPIGSEVRFTCSEQELARFLEEQLEFDRAAALGEAMILTKERTEVMGVHDLTDDKGVSRPAIVVMDSSGQAFPFWSVMLEPA